MDHLDGAVNIANIGLSQMLDYGIGMTVLTVTLLLSIGFNAFLLWQFVKFFDVIRNFTAAVTTLNERLDHD